MTTLHPDSANTRTRRKSSVMGPNRKLSMDVTRKLSAISTAPDISALSDRLGMEQDTLKTIVKDILDMDDNNKWESTSDDGHSDCGDYDDEGWETDQQIWETVRIEQKKKDSTTSQGSSTSDGNDVVDIDLEELNSVLNLYMRHQISVTSFLSEEKNMR